MRRRAREAVPLAGPAGTLGIIHYDLLHTSTNKNLEQPRHMIKFLFRRTSDNTAPTWNHDPDALGKPADWNKRAEAEDPTNILNFTNPLGVSQSDHYKERAIRQRNWAYLLGKPA